MQQILRSRANRQNISKFLLATALRYIIFSYTIPTDNTGGFMREGKLYQTQQWELSIGEESEQYIQDAMREIQNSAHGSDTSTTGDRLRIQTICASNDLLCKKILFESPFSDRERYIYISSVFHIVNFINKHLYKEIKTEDILHKITLNKSTGQRRGYATRDTIVFNLGYVGGYLEFLQLLNHEMGHIMDLGILQGTSKTIDKNYTEFGRAVFGIDDISFQYYRISRDSESIRKSSAVKKDFCSGYGMSNPFEDFSECFNLYLQHNALFRTYATDNALMRNKYNFLAGLFDGKYIRNGKSPLSTEERVRDTTKIN